ncbi:helix-turn-helix transcriptional regulator [Haliangium sp. UPWRP_2]|uniref:helix-turn-helix domain-containing protein n=1 Tax=Haliangium sp. UPWRP_2 TaxID=1931276 RepID=UPI000D0D6870|nr:helix-turn-helix transcriptional regulator [Haliangium sp. UPWRP_2]PSM31940.1 transcriptional regulator [Haliangium sp. UPWRP_2]
MKISGKQVAAARELLGLTQTELAAAAGVSAQTIFRFEAGKAEPQRTSLEKILTELARRGIEFTNGTGTGVRLDHAKAAEFSRAAGAAHAAETGLK